MELFGIHCEPRKRAQLRRYTKELIVDDPYDDVDVDDVDARPFGGSEPIESSVEDEGWEPDLADLDDDRDSQRWHSSDVSFTDEEGIDADSEESEVEDDLDDDDDDDDDDSDDDSEGDVGADGFNPAHLHTWGPDDGASDYIYSGDEDGLYGF